MSSVDRSIEGDWSTQIVYCNLGYRSTWTVNLLEEGEEAIIEEQCGSYCLGCVSNCVPKRGCFSHQMEKVQTTTFTTTGAYAEGSRWEGRLCGKPMKLTKVSDTELKSLTTEGPMRMTRQQRNEKNNEWDIRKEIKHIASRVSILCRGGNDKKRPFAFLSLSISSLVKGVTINPQVSWFYHASNQF